MQTHDIVRHKEYYYRKLNKNMREKKDSIPPYLIIFFITFFLGSTPVKIQDLPPKYRSWLSEEVVYIITEKEKSAFLQLESDRERDLFIGAFWRQRDPAPETPENEFQVEHYRRIHDANKSFGRGTSKPGWKTDRGRISIILGKPGSVTSYGEETYKPGSDRSLVLSGRLWRRASLDVLRGFFPRGRDRRLYLIQPSQTRTQEAARIV